MWLALVAGCGEHWVASDDLVHAFSGPGEFGLRLTVEPEAWPRDEWDGAVRVSWSGAGELASLDVDRDVGVVGTNSLNTFDAFDGCDHDRTCVVDLSYFVHCQACDGRVTADAFLSVQGPAPRSLPGEGALRLEWSEPTAP